MEDRGGDWGRVTHAESMLEEENMDKEIVVAVKERIRMAEGWSKYTRYPPSDYFDTLTDLRRMVRLYDVAESERIEWVKRAEAAEARCEALNGEKTQCGVHGCAYIGACPECYRIATDMVKSLEEKVAAMAAAWETVRSHILCTIDPACAEHGFKEVMETVKAMDSAVHSAQPILDRVKAEARAEVLNSLHSYYQDLLGPGMNISRSELLARLAMLADEQSAASRPRAQDVP